MTADATTLILGGGLAGAAAACLLGPRATLIEREPVPRHKVCGEFLSWEAQSALQRLGLDPASLGGAPIRHVRLVHGHRTATAPLPGQAIGLSRRTLDEAVLHHAAGQGALIHRGHAVRHLVPGGAEIDGLGPLHAAHTLLATGKHDLRHQPRPNPTQPLLGFKMLFRLTPAQRQCLVGHVEVILFPGGYAGLQPIEAGQANLCLLVTADQFRQLGATWPALLAHLVATTPQLATRLAGATPLFPRPLSIARIPYGHRHSPASTDPPTLFRIGDQAAVIPSFSGDGMAIALHTAFAAARAIARADTPHAYHHALAQDLGGQLGRAMLLHRLGQSRPALVTTAARLWPGALTWIARLTRVPAARLAWA